MKKLYFCLTSLTLLIFGGCMNTSPTSGAKVDMNTATCPDKPKESLDSQDVESIILTNQILTKQIIARQDRAIGLTFEGKAGQNLSYTKDNKNICSWVFTPENQILTRDVLPTSGKYTMQILALQGFPKFDLAIGLDVISTSASTIAVSPIASMPNTPNTTNIPNSTTISRTAPEQAVRDYYSKINSRQYVAAWSQLTPKFQREKSENNYAKFIEWWNSVKQVVIQQVILINKSNDTATVDVKLKYFMQDGKDWSDSARIYLVWNESASLWSFNESERQENQQQN